MSDQPKDIGELLKPVYDLQDRRTAEDVERFKAEAWERAQVKWGTDREHWRDEYHEDSCDDGCKRCRLDDIAELLGIEVTGTKALNSLELKRSPEMDQLVKEYH